MSEGGQVHETLIIKRRGGAHDEHHGGVWKIAFADFMTAMMAFFLVMWLVSANDKTKATIAKYFNPIELVDSTPKPVGLNDSKKDDPSIDRKGQPPETMQEDKDGKPAEKAEKAAVASDPTVPKPVHVPPLDDAEHSAKHDELEVIRDPYAVIAEVAAKTSAAPPKQSAVSAGQPAGGTDAVGAKGGEAFRDPFAPMPVADGNPLAAVAEAEPARPAAPPPSPPPAGPDTEAASHHTAETAAAPAQGSGSGKSGAPQGEVAEAVVANTGDDKPLPPAALRGRIVAIVKASEGGASGPKIDVRKTDEGTLISLTDSADFAMFASASARPSPKAVALMAKIGRLLKGQKGGITIRGFTDSRPFRSDTYDNWRLSTQRAHLAQYMLERGGLDEDRIDRIEGYADRRPKNAKDPEAAENRRIEILLRNPAP